MKTIERVSLVTILALSLAVLETGRATGQDAPAPTPIVEKASRETTTQRKTTAPKIAVEPSASPAAGVAASPANIEAEEALDAEGDDERPTRRLKKANDMVRIGQSETVPEGETVKDAVVVGGDLIVLGTVRGDAVCVGGNLTLGPKAYVRGDTVSIGGQIEADPAARTDGQRVSIGGPFLGKLIGRDLLRHHVDREVRIGHHLPLGKLVIEIVYFLFMIFLALLMTVFLPRQLSRIGEHLAQAFPRSALLGLAAMVLVPLLVLILFITCVGSIFVPLVALVVAVTAWMGYIAFAEILGRRLIGERSVLAQIIVGLALLQCASFVAALLAMPGGIFALVAAPLKVMGAVIFIGANAIGLGAVAYSRWGRNSLDDTLTPPSA
ncbi:MAG: hypothetical protein MUF51_01505 [Vicinamibacteria bacterium]|nr:hypothetical protein [Vicinamibacteria bacterium]